MAEVITEVTSVSSKGQVVLPKNVRDALSLHAGSKLIVVTDGEKFHLSPCSIFRVSAFLPDAALAYMLVVFML